MVMPLDRLASLTTVTEETRERGRLVPGVATTRQVWCRLQRTRIEVESIVGISNFQVEGKQQVLIRYDPALLVDYPYTNWTIEIDGVTLNITGISEETRYQRHRYMRIEIEGVV